MTDDRPPIDGSDEELVSAYLDGEATPVERERVEADPQLLALVDSYRSVAGAVGSPVMPLDQPRRDTMVAAALAVLDDQADRVDDEADDEVDDEAPGSAAKVVSLAGRRRWISRAPGLAAAAAILFLVGIGLVLSSNGSDRDQQADNASATAEQSTSGDDLESQDATRSADEESDTGGSGPAAAPDNSSNEALATDASPAIELGEFADVATLRQALASNPPVPGSGTRQNEDAADPDAEAEEPGSASSFESEADRCADVVTTTDSALGDLVAVRTATLAGEPVLIFSHTERDKPDRTIDTVTDRGSCQILFAQAR